MPQAKPQSSRYAALTFELVTGESGVTTEAHLLPPGPFRSTDSRPVECQAWQLDAAIAAKVIARMAAQKNDLLIDYEHQNLRSRENGQKVLAAGWCPKSLEWRPSTGSGQASMGGLYATNIAWTDAAKAEIQARQYRYISTVFYYDGSSGEVLEIHSVALTNTPAIDGLDALAAMARADLTRNQPPQGENQMDKDQQIAALSSENGAVKTQLAALTSERDGLKTQLAALTTECDGYKVKIDVAEQEKAHAALTAEKIKRDELMVVALTVVPPAEKDFLDSLTVAQLTRLIETKKPLALLNKQAGGKNDETGSHGLNDVELAMCTRTGVSPEEFVKNKKK